MSVVETNEPPNAEPDTVTTPYETPVKVDATANDEDLNGDDLTITEVTQGLHGECSITDDNQILYTPEPGYSGPDICPYVVCDNSGECDTANVFIEVEDGPPIPEIDTAVTAPGTPVLVDVVENDSHPNDLPLEVTFVTTQPENGACELVDGQVQYTPDDGFTMGTDQCMYIVCVEGTDKCDAGTLIVDVVPPKPVAEDDRTETPPRTPVLVDVVANDSHPNDLPLQVIDIATNAENGVCIEEGGQVKFTPDADFNEGADRCTYIVCVKDNIDVCDEATLIIDIIKSPIAEDDEARTPMNTPVVVVSINT